MLLIITRIDWVYIHKIDLSNGSILDLQTLLRHQTVRMLELHRGSEYMETLICFLSYMYSIIPFEAFNM